MCFKWLTDYDVEWLQNSSYASWYDYKVAFLSSQSGLHIFGGMAPKAVYNQHQLLV
jgi:hypothetical protein